MFELEYYEVCTLWQREGGKSKILKKMCDIIYGEPPYLCACMCVCIILSHSYSFSDTLIGKYTYKITTHITKHNVTYRNLKFI